MRDRTVVSILVVLWGATVVMVAVTAPAQESTSAPALVHPTPPAAMAEARVTAALEAVETARGHLGSGDSRSALEALQEASKLMVEAQRLLVAARFANTRCPITGIAIDPAHVPESQTRLYKGQVVALSSERSVIEWDRLTDPEKDSKLAGATGAIARPEVGARVINFVCPIDGNRFDPVEIRDQYTRTFRGQRVGFCSYVDGLKWDRLSDAQRDASLKKALAGPVNKVANTIDPIDGQRVDPVSVHDDLIRVWRGYRIGLRRTWCLQRWDRLSPAEKDARVRAILPGEFTTVPAASGSEAGMERRY